MALPMCLLTKFASGLRGLWSAAPETDRHLMRHDPAYKFLFGAFAFVFGATVGSFLNVLFIDGSRPLY